MIEESHGFELIPLNTMRTVSVGPKLIHIVVRASLEFGCSRCVFNTEDAPCPLTDGGLLACASGVHCSRVGVCFVRAQRFGDDKADALADATASVHSEIIRLTTLVDEYKSLVSPDLKEALRLQLQLYQSLAVIQLHEARVIFTSYGDYQVQACQAFIGDSPCASCRYQGDAGRCVAEHPVTLLPPCRALNIPALYYKETNDGR